MNQRRQHFIHRNEGFRCQHCAFENDPLAGSCRNHCTQCLYSLHVDAEVPGDRASDCQGLMEPVTLDHHGKKGRMIVHRCLTCGKEMRNMVAPDDDFDAIIALSQAH